MAKTLFEKIWERHVVSQLPGGNTLLYIDRHLIHEVTSPQAFEGLILARKHGAEMGGTFTVRKVASGVGVERIFPIYSPSIDKIEVVKKSRARRSKLYYVRTKAVRDIRRKMKSVTIDANEKESK